MASIAFCGISEQSKPALAILFDYLADAKRQQRIDARKIKEMLGQAYQSKFWWPTPEEQHAWIERWIAADQWARDNNPQLQRPWDFDSWVAELDHIDVELQSLEMDAQGVGHLYFQPGKHFSGKLGALEHLITVFDGHLR